MDALLSKSCGIAAAQRGQIVQRVLVDGWSTAQAAATFGLQERRVARKDRSDERSLNMAAR